MQRLALAVIVVAAAAALIAALVSAVRRTEGDLPARVEGGTTQKLSFALLSALVLYVAFGGGG